VLLLSALWLAVVQALAPLAVPAALRGPVDGLARVSGVAASAEASSAGRSPAQKVGTRLWAGVLGDEEFRAPAPQRLPAVGRTSDRSVPPLRSPGGPAALVPAHLSLSLSSLAPPAQHRVSHAAVSRGGHLPYYPTAPPLQG
jgi:hypothetical protein